MSSHWPKRVKEIAVVGGLIALVLVVTAYRRGKSTTPDLIVGIVHDRSLSSRDSCASVVALAEQKIDAASEVSQNLHLLLFATGDKSTANEPIAFMPPPVLADFRVIDGKAEREEARAGILTQTREWCSHLEDADSSPILVSVERSLEQIQSRKKNTSAHAYLFVQTDLQEHGGDHNLESAIHGKGNFHPATQLNNSGIEIQFCGYAETRGEFSDKSGKVRRLTMPRSLEQDSRLKTVWQTEFTNPSIVNFVPFCPKL